jgi:hypothetical protein
VTAGLTVPALARGEAARVLGADALAAVERSARVEQRPYGSLIARLDTSAGLRRVIELDPDGGLAAVLAWSDDGALTEASVRIPDGRVVTVEPRATTDATWGPCDRLWLGARPGRAGASPLVTFSAVDYAAIRAIPPLADPTRLPSGAGTSVLNLMSGLAADHSAGPLPYAGPWPTEQLFLALLESFRFVDGDAPDLLAAFMTGALRWTPAPHERRHDASGAVVQLRDGVEKVIWGGRTYYRAGWQSVTRHAPRRVRDDGAAVVCSLWALGVALEDHVRCAPDGRSVAIVAPPPATGPGVAIDATTTAGVAAAVAATSIPALAPFVRDVAHELSLAWAPVTHGLIAVDGLRARLSPLLRATAAREVRAAPDRATAVAIAFALVAEMAALLGDTLRAEAQARLASRPAAEQAAALEVTEDPGAAEAPRVIAAAADALLADLTR